MHLPNEYRESSLAKRYLFKLCSNIITIPLFLLQEAILPRILGPSTYGNFNFATALYTQIVNLFDSGSSSCMRISLSKRPGEFGIITFYLRIALLIFIVTLLCGGIAFFPSIGEKFLPDVPLWMAPPAALYAYLLWLGSTTRGMNDATGTTTSSEIIRILVNLGATLSLLLLFFLNILNLSLFYIQQILTYSLLIFGYCIILKYTWKQRYLTWPEDFMTSLRLSPSAIRYYFQEYKRFCGPLFIMALCSSLALITERWLLQYFGGSVAQGYFSLSQKIGAACFLCITAMLPLLQRELSVAHQKNNTVAMAAIITRYAPLLYAAAAWFACFVSVEAPAVIRIFAGGNFIHAVLPVQIMAFYPVHQVYGQLTTTVYYAAGETGALKNVTLISLALGLVCVWMFIAPSSLGGLELKATGLALKMVIIQIVTVNILMWKCSRFIGFSFKYNVLHQLICPIAFVCLALFTQKTTETVFSFTSLSVVRFFISGFLYSLVSLILIFCFPSIIGFSRKDFSALLQRSSAWLKNK